MSISGSFPAGGWESSKGTGVGAISLCGSVKQKILIPCVVLLFAVPPNYCY